MCFSVNVNLVKDELENRYGASFPEHDRYQPSYYYHAFALPEMPALCSGSEGQIRLLKWGLIPSWAKDYQAASEIRFKTFNARAETVRTKPSYSRSFRSKRCLIPVKGFFEWQHDGNRRIPYYIYHSSENIFSIAGLFDEWTETTTGETFSTFTIITTDANDLLAVIHNSKKRMPVILDRNDEGIWISRSTTEDEAFSLLKPCSSEILKAHAISDLVNSKTADKNTPEVIQPFSRNNQTLLF